MEKVTINGKEYTIDIEKCKEQGLLQEEKWYPKSFEDLRHKFGVIVPGFETRVQYDAYEELHRLIVLRDWWWKNLCNGWKPDWTDYERKYIIIKKGCRITDTATIDIARTLAFPTAEIRDKFHTAYEGMINIAAQFI